MESITLIEHKQKEVILSSVDVETLRSCFSKQMEVWPTVEPGKYLIKARSFAGVIVLPSGRAIYIDPKVPIQTLFAMLARVYDPDSEIFREQPQPYSTISELFEFIVSFFISHTEDLIARGLLRGYQSRKEELQTIRGRLLIAETIHGNPGLFDKHYCSYRYFTPDIPENRILLWTSSVLREWKYIDSDLPGRLRRIQFSLGGVSLDPNARLLAERLEFHRLNDSYQPAMVLARLILDHLAFTGTRGTEPFLAFLIDMDVLFQQYLTVVLQQVTNETEYWVRKEEAHSLDQAKSITVIPDILLYKREKPCVIVDAKYKLRAALEDVYQMLAYCHALGLDQAILVHPKSESSPIGSVSIIGPGDIQISYLSLDLDGSVQELHDQSIQLFAEIIELLSGPIGYQLKG